MGEKTPEFNRRRQARPTFDRWVFCIGYSIHLPQEVQMIRHYALTLVVALVPALLQGQALADAEREPLLKSLEMTHEKLMHMSEHLTPEQWNWKPAPDRWSVGEVAEHILVTEQAFMKTLTGPFLESTVAMSEKVEMPAKQIAAIMRDRSTKFQAPDAATPTGRWSSQTDFAKAFKEQRKATIKFVKGDADLHGHVYQNPALGVLDGEQWLAFIAYHGERHVLQAEEVMHHDGFPKHDGDLAKDHEHDEDHQHDKAHEKDHNEKHE
jgi:hypothetical protein